MHLRRALLLFALVLGLTALAASIAPVPHTDDDEPVQTPPPPAPAASEIEAALSFHAPPKRGRGPVRAVKPNLALDVTVESDAAGEILIPRLERTESVNESAPARFSLLSPPPGRYDLLFQPAAGGEPERVGSIVTKR